MAYGWWDVNVDQDLEVEQTWSLKSNKRGRWDEPWSSGRGKNKIMGWGHQGWHSEDLFQIHWF